MKGGDLIFNDYKYGFKERTDDRILFGKKNDPLSLTTIISLLLATNNGSNPFIGERFFGIGLINILVASLFPLFAMHTSFKAYLRTWRFESETSYADSLQDAFSQLIITVIRVFMIFSLSNNLIYNCYDIYKYSGLLTYFFEPNSKILNNRSLHIYLLSAISIIPTLFVKKFSGLAVTSYISNICLFFVLAIMGYYAYQHVSVSGFNPTGKTTLYSLDFVNTINCLSNFILIYYVHPIICNLAPEMPSSTQGEITRVALYSNIASWFVNFAGGYIGWFCFFGSSNGNIAIVYYPQNVLTIIALFMGLIHVLATISLLNYLIGIDISKLFVQKGNNKIPFEWGCIASILFALSISLLPKFLLDIVTSLCQLTFLIVGFIVPPVAFLKIFGLKSKWGYFCVIYIIMLIILGSITLYIIFSRDSSR